MKKFFKSTKAKTVIAISSIAAAAPSYAAIDTTEAVAVIVGGVAAAAAIGSAYLLLKVGIKSYSMIRGS